MGEFKPSIVPKKDSKNDPVETFEALKGDIDSKGIGVGEFSDSFRAEAAEKLEGILGKKPDEEQIKSEEKKIETREEMIEELEKVWKQGIKDREEVEMMHNMREIDFKKISSVIEKLSKEIDRDRLSFIDDEEIKLKVKKLINLREFIIAESKRLEKSA